MSRKHASRKRLPGQHRSPRISHRERPISRQNLEEQWNALHLQPQMKDHLLRILQNEGLEIAVAATMALDLEMRREEQKVARSLWDWLREELRLLFLEEGCQHIIETGRIVIDAVLAWTLLWGPFLLQHLVLLLIPLGGVLISCSVIGICHHYRTVHGRRTR